MIRRVSIGFILLLFSGQCLAESMNLLIIQTDEHNFRTLGCYRDLLSPEQAFIWGKDAIVKTPAIDSIAKRGAVCTSYYATSPVCTPSRASFFSGRYPQHTGSPQNNLPLNSQTITFARVLQDQGYETGYAGKWHLDGSGKPQWGPERKFGFADNRYMFNRGHWKKFELTSAGPRVAARRNDNPNYNVDDANEKSFSTDWLTDRALDFIRAHKAKPFCYHLSLPDPHGPNTVRAPYDTMYEDMVIRPPMTFTQAADNPAWAKAGGKNAVRKFSPAMMAKYFGMVRCIDDNVGRLLRLLDELELTRKTAIVFTSDHGDLCYEHGRLNKGNPYEGSARIPMIIAIPGKVPAGTVVNEALGTVDFATTMLPLLGHEPPPGCQGRNASKLLLGQSDGWQDIAILRNAGTKASWLAAVTNRYKLVVSVNDSPWLFDMQTDPDELKNFIGKPNTANVTKKLAQHLVEYGKKVGDKYVNQKQIAHQLTELATR